MQEKILEKLQELTNLTLLSAKKALTMDDTALLTGLSKSHLYKLVSAKKIPYYKAAEGGKINYFDKDEITKWLLHRRFKTKDEIETDALNYCLTGKKGGKHYV